MIGAGGARGTVISDSGFCELLRLRGRGTDIRRGLTATVDVSCNFLDVSARLKSSFDRRGIRDLMSSGGEGGDGSCLDNREVVLVSLLKLKVLVLGVKSV